MNSVSIISATHAFDYIVFSVKFGLTSCDCYAPVLDGYYTTSLLVWLLHDISLSMVIT